MKGLVFAANCPSRKILLTLTSRWSVLILVALRGEFKHEVRQFEKSYDNQQAEQISLMV
jgi:DNA-binding HxlR family transcriptional regulator